jgi:hypothetical protein
MMTKVTETQWRHPGLSDDAERHADAVRLPE